MPSARVADPQLFSLWIRKSTGTSLKAGRILTEKSWKNTLFSGICNPRDNHCGYAIRAGRRPAVITLWIRKSTGTKQSTRTNVVIVLVRILHFLTFFDHLLTVTTMNDQNRTLRNCIELSLQYQVHERPAFFDILKNSPK